VQRPTGIGTRSIAIILVAAAAVALLAFPAIAGAAQKVIVIDGSVIPLHCQACHGTIADNKLPGILFSHAAHIIYSCSACHTTFPHKPQGTTIPGMKDCWNCHALRHGPQGVMAKAECTKCHEHFDPKRKPKTHIADWKNKPHVQPGRDELRTLCMRCHDRKWCDTCHVNEAIFWRPDTLWTYDAGNGCMACHGSDLPRLDRPVSGIEASAHRGTKCQQCHPDFKYDDTPDATKLWKVNAGKACQTCHDKEKPIKQPYVGSIHQQLIAEKDYTSATCSSCHGGHDIESVESTLATKAARVRRQLSGEKMCGGCHPSAWRTYNDWWHGAAYKRGTVDAPSCWDCHKFHDVRQKDDPKSTMKGVTLAKTCGGSFASNPKGCHEGSDEVFAEAGRSMIHGAVGVKAKNPVRKLLPGQK
jgi:hypothetical protein